MHPVHELKHPVIKLQRRHRSTLSPEWQVVVKLSAAAFLHALGKHDEAKRLERDARETRQ